MWTCFLKSVGASSPRENGLAKDILDTQGNFDRGTSVFRDVLGLSYEVAHRNDLLWFQRLDRVLLLGGLRFFAENSQS